MKVVFSEQQIQQRVQEIAHDVSRDCGDDVLYAVAVLEDGFMFLADLVRKMTSPVNCQFMKVQVADRQEGGHPLREIVYGTPGEIAGKQVLLVNAIVDSGITMDYLMQQMQQMQPRSVRIATLVNRENRRRVRLTLDYVGFGWEESEMLIGYGLDQKGLYRNLPYVAAVGERARPAARRIGKREAG